MRLLLSIVLMMLLLNANSQSMLISKPIYQDYRLDFHRADGSITSVSAKENSDTLHIKGARFIEIGGKVYEVKEILEEATLQGGINFGGNWPTVTGDTTRISYSGGLWRNMFSDTSNLTFLYGNGRFVMPKSEKKNKKTKKIWKN